MGRQAKVVGHSTQSVYAWLQYSTIRNYSSNTVYKTLTDNALKW